mgnify:CR=1 FL=1
MQEYKVIKNCQIGQLTLQKGDIIYFEEYDKDRDYIIVKHYPEKRQPVGKEAARSYLELQLIEKY